MAERDQAEEQALHAMVLLPEELESMGASLDSRGGGGMAVRIFLEVEGFGSFTAGLFNTANGIASAWVPAGKSLPLTAEAAQGWQFSHWLVNGLFGGTSPKHEIAARPLLKIRAVFTNAPG